MSDIWISFFNYLPFFVSLFFLVFLVVRRLLLDARRPCGLKLEYFTYRRLSTAFFIFVVAFNLFLSVWQYQVWQSAPFSRFFLPPYQPWTYFLSYVYMHFWLSSLLTLIVALILVVVLYLLTLKNREMISRDEIFLFFLASFLAPWPRLLFMWPLFFVLAFFGALLNYLFFKKQKIDIFWPLILSLILVLLWADQPWLLF